MPGKGKSKLVIDEAVSAEALRKITTAARPLIEEAINNATELAALRDAATAQGIDWSQLKALIKAQIQDEEDGGSRVKRLLTKADNATAYADLLGLDRRGERNFSAPHDPATGEIVHA